MAGDPDAAAIARRLSVGQTWRSPKTWWRIAAIDAGRIIVEGPRGTARTSGTDPATIMTVAGFNAWIRKSGATLAVRQAIEAEGGRDG